MYKSLTSPASSSCGAQAVSSCKICHASNRLDGAARSSNKSHAEAFALHCGNIAKGGTHQATHPLTHTEHGGARQIVMFMHSHTYELSVTSHDPNPHQVVFGFVVMEKDAFCPLAPFLKPSVLGPAAKAYWHASVLWNALQSVMAVCGFGYRMRPMFP